MYLKASKNTFFIVLLPLFAFLGVFSLVRESAQKPIGDVLNIFPSKSFLDLPKKNQNRQMRLVVSELLKMPPSLIYKTLISGGKELHLVANNVTQHPYYAHLAGVKPRGWKSGGWEKSPGINGIGMGPFVVAPARLFEKFGKPNLLLHEFAHALDFVGERISSEPEWQKIHTHCKWSKAYFRNNTRESFARSFALYYHSSKTRNVLKGFCIDAYKFLGALEDRYQKDELGDFKKRLVALRISLEI